MLDAAQFLRSSTCEKQRVTKGQNFEIGSAASEDAKKILASRGLRLRQHFHFYHVGVLDKKSVILKEVT